MAGPLLASCRAGGAAARSAYHFLHDEIVPVALDLAERLPLVEELLLRYCYQPQQDAAGAGAAGGGGGGVGGHPAGLEAEPGARGGMGSKGSIGDGLFGLAGGGRRR